MDGAVDNIYAKLPAGFVADPNAVPKCTAEQFAVVPLECPPETQVGVLHIHLVGADPQNYPGSNEEIVPVYNLEPREGNVAELGVPYLSTENTTTVRIVAKARTNDDFGVSAFAAQIPAALPLIAQSLTVWGVPWSDAHDHWRMKQGWRPGVLSPPDNITGEIPVRGLPPGDQAVYDLSWEDGDGDAVLGEIKPFVSNPTECSGQPLFTRAMIDSFERQGAFTPEGDPNLLDSDWKVYESPADPVTGCEKVPFSATFDPQLSSSTADAPSGLSADVTIPQNDDPPAGVANDPDHETGAPAFWRSDDGIATSQLEKTVVTLPAGVSVNPAGATGLAGCTDAQMGVTDAGASPMLFNNEDPFDGKGVECPEGSIIGSVRVDTPLLEQPLTGQIVLGMPRKVNHDGNPSTPPKLDPESGQMFRLFIVARDKARGLLAKIAGTSTAAEDTGQLAATFEKNPRVPVENIHVELKGGQRGLLALPQDCGAPGWTSVFTPWTAAHGAGGVAVSDEGSFTIDQRCALPFAPTLSAAMTEPQAGGSSTFTFRFGRSDGQQWIRGLTARLPQGLLASVKHVPLCTNAQASANACPLASKIGSVDAGAGSGTPFFLERDGSVFLTEGYKGAPYGLAVSVPVEAGPFRGSLALDPIVVRQALRVDPEDASVTAESDPFPIIHFGIPLRVREVTVKIDRPGFMRAPTDCSQKQIQAAFASSRGATANRSQLFQASGCRGLAFKPRLGIRLTGGKRHGRYGGHPGVKAVLTQPAGQAGIKATTVRLPKALALDTNRASDDRRLCEFEAAKTVSCPASSIIGRARAVSPLLKAPLTGNVYFAKDVRINEFGRQVRTFPSLIVALRGEIAVNIRAKTTFRPGKLISKFPTVPDAPVSRFVLNLRAGSKSVLVVTRDARTERKLNLCGRQIAEVDMDAHNGKRRDFNVRMKTPCKKKPKRKRAARRKGNR